MKGNLIVWLAIGGAGYMVYRYLQTSGLLGGAVAAKPAEEAEKPAVEQAKPADFAAISRNDLFNFAQGRSAAGWDGRLTIGEWNWMVSQKTGVEQQRDLLAGGADPGAIYAEEYLARRVTAGISGMGYLMPLGWA
jgi:hypothetical protein